MRGEAQKFGIPARRAGIMAAHAFADLHESVLDVARMFVVIQVFGDLLIRNLASEPRVPPKQKRHEHDQPCSEEKKYAIARGHAWTRGRGGNRWGRCKIFWRVGR